MQPMSSCEMYKAELHVHSNFSDGRDSVRKLLEEALRKRIELISITDHNTIQGSLEAMDIVIEEKIPIVVIPGIEVSTSTGHLLVFGLVKDIEPGLSMGETCGIAKSLDCITALAHPFDIFRKGSLKIEDFKIVDCVEVFNAKSYFNFLAKRYAEKFGKRGIGGSDAHAANQIGLVVNYLEIPEKKAILKAFFDGRKQRIRERVISLLSRINPKP